MKCNPTWLCDFYKISHRAQYPKNTEVIYSTWTPRRSLVDGVDYAIAFGFQQFIKEFLIDYFNDNFFNRDWESVEKEYVRFIKNTLGDKNPETFHLKHLHNIGYLPVKITAVPEGTKVPLRVPMLTIENTKKEFFWVTNFLETLLSTQIWKPSTTATTASRYYKILSEWAEKTSDTSMVQWQAHDFSMRGQSCWEDAARSGIGHLLYFTGTDTCPAISQAEEYYNANIENELVGSSISASEHSTMEAWGLNEYETFKALLTEIYPSGVFSAVSDTWNLWNILTKTLPSLKNEIMARDGKIVIRADSGDPVLIICGDSNADINNPHYEQIKSGVIDILWDNFGGTINEKGYKILDSHVGCIYGDAITPDRMIEICKRLEAKGYASINCIFGVGSFSYQYVTRDTYGFAQKTTFGVFGGVEKDLFKDPITDSGFKKSQRGKVFVTNKNGTLEFFDGDEAKVLVSSGEDSVLRTIFEDGKLLVDDSLEDIRKRVRAT